MTISDAAEWPAVESNAKIALRDLAAGVTRSWMWSALAMQDIRLRYRGSMLGPFWLTISIVVMILAMGLLYAKLFRQDPAGYLPFLMVGLIVWQFISTTINESSSTFLVVSSVIQQVPLPFSLHAFRVVCRNLIVMAHNAIIVPFGLWWFGIPVGWHTLLVIPGLALLAFDGVCVSLLLGMISTRFRDVAPIVNNFVQVVFFVTPIFWPPAQLGRWQGIAQLNPLFAAIDIVRAPVLGIPMAPYSWLVMAAVSVAAGAVTFLAFARFRRRIPYWL